VSWTGFSPDGTVASRVRLLEHARFTAYFTWFERGLQKLYGCADAISLDSWDTWSTRIADAYARDAAFHWQALRTMGYETLLQDAYWDPGDDTGHPELFKAAFRIDKFMYGHHATCVAPNEFNPWTRYGFEGGDLDDYVALMQDIIRRSRAAGKTVALKCAEAYCRNLQFLPDDRNVARHVFGVPPHRLSAEQKGLFGNYIFNRCCELAAELDLPFQIHTGLAQLAGSQPLRLEPILARYPRTRFVLFHSGYPWVHEVAGLAHNYSNVLPSLTWTPIISTSAAIRALHEYLDVAHSVNTITWGSDCHVAEESIGALLAWQFVVAKVLTERLADGRLTVKQAEELARKLMVENGRRVYLGAS
jgi:hypothetical protein